MFSKKRICIPIIIGVSFCLISIVITVGVQKTKEAATTSFGTADEKIAELITTINQFTSQIVEEMLSSLESARTTINNAVSIHEEAFKSHMENYVQTLFTSINNEMDSVFPIDPPNIDVANFQFDSISLPQLVPRIPNLNMSVLAIPTDVISLQRDMFPAVQDSLKVPEAIAYILWIIGLIMCNL